jgi:hypothetical protein
MSGLIRALTVVLLAVPLVFIVGAARDAGPRLVMAPVAALLIVLYAAVWLFWRPTAFEVGPNGLVLRFPLRRLEIVRGNLAGAWTVDRDAMCARYGLALRVGVGGLWGGFGWLWTRRRGFVDMYVSRTDGVVLVERRSGRDLIITPERPEEFVRAVGARA